MIKKPSQARLRKVSAARVTHDGHQQIGGGVHHVAGGIRGLLPLLLVLLAALLIVVLGRLRLLLARHLALRTRLRHALRLGLACLGEALLRLL